MYELTYTDDECNDETQPIEPIRHQLIETDMHAAPPLPRLWTTTLTLLEDDALEMIHAWADNNRRILRRMRAMMRNDGMPY